MIYGYVRVSTDKQSTENQRFEIEQFAKAKSMRIDRWVEETISGTTDVAETPVGIVIYRIPP